MGNWRAPNKIKFKIRVIIKPYLSVQVIDYRAVDLVEHLRANYSSPETQFDIIYDCAGLTPALYPSSPAYLNPAGIFVDICAMATAKETGGQVRSFVRLLERTWRPSWLGGTPRRYKSALLLAHHSVRGPVLSAGHFRVFAPEPSIARLPVSCAHDAPSVDPFFS